MEEIWKDVVGYEGLYEVSNQGQVRSHHPSPRKKKGECLRQGNLRGYRIVILCKDKARHTALVHRIVAIAFLGAPPNVHRPTVNHKNLDKADNRVENLEWLSQADNCRHAAPLIPRQRGEERPNAKLKEDDVRSIRARHKSGNETIEAIARCYGISGAHCHLIIQRKKWKHVE